MRMLLIFSIVFSLLSCGNKKTQDTGSEISVIENSNVVIRHNECGDGEIALLFVHGWCIDQTYWSNQMDALCDQYKIVTIDLPGFGQSGTNRENFTIPEYGNDVRAVIDQLQLHKVILIGHSMGGDVILEAAVNNEKVIALIGIDNFKDVGVPFTEETQKEVDGFMVMLKESFHEIAPAYAEGSLFHPSTDSLVKQRVMQNFEIADSVAAISSLENLLDYGKQESNQLSMLKQKLYLINSDATPTYIEGLNETGVNYEVIDIPATGHYPMIEKPGLFNQLLSETIRKILADQNQTH